MPAPFAKELLGYRVKNGAVTPFPNTSDSNDKQSVYLGQAMLEEIGVAPGTPGPTDPGGLLEVRTIEHLSALRPDLEINRARERFELVAKPAQPSQPIIDVEEARLIHILSSQ